MSVKSNAVNAVNAVKKVVSKVKKAVTKTPLLEESFQVREMVFIQGLDNLIKETGVILSLATRDSKDLGSPTVTDSRVTQETAPENK